MVTSGWLRTHFAPSVALLDCSDMLQVNIERKIH